MNIFVLDTDPRLAARYHCDKHVVKMILETAQLLSTAHHVLNPNIIQRVGSEWRLSGHKIYGPTHTNHPCAVWVRESMYNYEWTLSLGRHLCEEYTRRYGKEHKTSKIIHTLSRYDPACQRYDITAFRQCMPEECKVPNDPVQAYRNYYRTHKRDIARWKLGNVPQWMGA
jgi:hypothetical protein